MYLHEKIEVLKESKCEKEVYDYLNEILKNLKIEITTKYKASNVFKLMNLGALEGWCFQTSECAILFFDDNDYIQRGNLKSDLLNEFLCMYPLVKYYSVRQSNYYHSWIVFNYNDEEYIFDPCLQIITYKTLYDNIFTPEVLGMVYAKDVKENIINTFKNRINTFEKGNLNKKELVINSSDDVNSPNYVNGAGYILEEDDNKILSLTAHYYNLG